MAIFYPKGRYLCRITGQALGKASTGTKQFVLKFLVLYRVVGPEQYEDVPAQYERTSYHYITEKTIERFIQDLQTLGFSGSSFHELDPHNPTFYDFRGKEVEMYCSEDQNQKGEPRERWSVAKQGELEIDPLDAKEWRELDTLFGKQLKSLKPANAPKPTQKPQPSAQMTTEFNDDDVPF